MIYEKLPVVLLSALATEKRASANAVIAEYVLLHRKEAARLGIKELAERCHVGTGSVSRFCKEIGLADFAELKQLLADTSFAFQTVERATGRDTWIADWNAHVARALSLATNSVNETKLAALCRDLHDYEKVSAYGMLKAQSAAINLQVDLLMQGKLIDTCTAYAEQMERIGEAARDELIIIFSYTGSYFSGQDPCRGADVKDRPKIWMVCAAQEERPAYVDDFIFFSSLRDQLSHPYQLEAVAGLIAQEYAARGDEQTGL